MRLERKVPKINGRKGTWWVVVDSDSGEAVAAFHMEGWAREWMRANTTEYGWELVECDLMYG